MSLLQRARDQLGGLLAGYEWNVGPESSPAEQLPGADPAAAASRYKDNYRLASEAALRAGVSGWNMVPAMRSAAQGAYESDLVRSAGVVEQVRKMRDQSGARDRLARMIADPSSAMTKENREILGTLAPDDALKQYGDLVRNPTQDQDIYPVADGAFVRGPDGSYQFQRTRDPRVAGGSSPKPLQKSVLNPATGQTDLVLYDPFTLEEIARQPGAGAAPSRGGIEQAKAAGLALRMDASGAQLDSFGDYTPTGTELVTIQKIVSGEGGPLVMASLNATLSPQAQRYAAYVNDWIRAKLRAESGAVIGVDEFIGDFLTFMPMPNDDKETLAVKRRLRQQAGSAMRIMAGGAYQRPGQPAPGAPPPAPAPSPAAAGVPDPTTSPLWRQLGVQPVNGGAQ